jgi:hypothetical protein
LKTSLAYLLAKQMNCNLVKSDDILKCQNIYKNFNVDGHPLIVLIDEIEQKLTKTDALCKLMKLTTDLQRNTEKITTKTKWNDFFDKYQNNNFIGLVIFMTTNINISVLETEFPAMFNNARIDLKINI